MGLGFIGKLPKIGGKFAKKAGKEAAESVGESMVDAAKSFINGMFSGGMSSGKGFGVSGRIIQKGYDSSNVDSMPIPTMEEPTVTSEVISPSLATITKQLSDLVQTANRIGMYVKEQQDSIYSSIDELKRNSKEDQLESNIPVGPNTELTGESLSPMKDSVDALVGHINNLIKAIDSKASEANVGDENEEKGWLETLKDKFFKSGKAKKAGMVAAGVLGATAVTAGAVEGLDRVDGVDNIADPMAKKIPSESAVTKSQKNNGTNKISELISGKIGSDKSKSDVSEKIRKSASPIIERALGKLSTKPITLTGSMDAQSAINQVMSGNAIAAGIDVSGSGAALTAIPALVASVSRDIYSNIYNLNPDNDPEFEPRINSINDVVQDVVRDYLSRAIKSSPTGSQDVPSIETPTSLPQSIQSGIEPKTPVVNTSPASMTTENVTPTSNADSGVSDATPTASSSNTAEQISAAANKVEQPSDSGQILNAQSMPADDIWSNYGYDKESEMFVPQSTKSNRSGTQGIGNIPDPVYRASNLDELKTKLYFNY